MSISIVRKGERKVRSRGLLIGSPNSGKTRILNSIEEERVIVLSFPGEKGVKSIPLEQENIESLVLESGPLSNEADQAERYARSMEQYQVVLKVTRQILRGEYGEYDIFFLDGFSKFYETILDVVCKGRFLQGIVFSETGDYTTRLYQASHTLARNYLSEIYESSLFPLVITTCWEKLREPDQNASSEEVREHVRKGKRVWMPALPGQMGDLATGEFDWCVRASYTMPGVCSHCIALSRAGKQKDVPASLHGTFQVLPYDDVQCVGVKGRSISPQYTFIHQEWRILKALVS